MELKNETPYPTYLFRTVVDRHRSLASLVARVTFDLTDGRLVPSKDQVWRVMPEPWISPGGPMEPDSVFRKAGVDLHVFGTAHAPGGARTGSFDLVLSVGKEVRRRTLRGERTWVEQGGELVPSPPVPMTSLPLGMEAAFGGKADNDGLEVVCVDNPAGKGFYLEREQAIGGPLPQIEDPAEPIRTWEDRPPPAGLGFCAFPSGIRLREAIVQDGRKVVEIKPRLFNTAFPDLIFDSVPPGTRVSLSGCSKDGPFAFDVPDLALGARVELGALTVERPLAIEQIGLEPDHGRVFVGYRRQIRYRLNPRELRRMTLFEGPCAGAASPGGPHEPSAERPE